MRRRRGAGFIVMAAALAALVGGYATIRQRARTPAVDVVTASKGDILQTVSSISASVQPRVEITVAAERPGRVVQLRARLGQQVKAGHVVAILTDPVLDAELTQAAVDVDRARTSLERMRALNASALIPLAELEAADFDHRVATARLATLEAQRQQLTIRARIAGTVTAEHVKPGELLGGTTGAKDRAHGLPIVTLSTLNDLVVKGYIDEADILKVHDGQDARITMDAIPGEAFAGSVTDVAPSPAVTSGDTTYEVTVAFNTPPRSVAAGVRASVRIVIASADGVLRVPQEALFPIEDGQGVFVLDVGRGRLRHVETGISDPVSVEIRSGIVEGEKVIVGFPDGLRDGDRVTLRRPQ